PSAKPTAAATPAPAEAPPAAPPAAKAAKTLRYVVIRGGKPAGDGEMVVAADGTIASHYQYNDRGRGPDVTSTLALDEAGAPRTMHTHGHDFLKAPLEERLEVKDGQLVWSSTSEHGNAPVGAGFYIPGDGPVGLQALLIQALRRAPDHRLKLLPGGDAWIESEATLNVEIGGQPRRLARVALAGMGFQPWLVWLDENGEYFGTFSTWFSTRQAGGEALVSRLIAEGQRWSEERAARLAKELTARPPAAGLAITHARLFDPVKRTVTNDVTVVIVGDRIRAVGGAGTRVPKGAQVVDA